MNLKVRFPDGTPDVCDVRSYVAAFGADQV